MPVNTKSEAFKAIEDDLELVGTLWGGTKAMREAGKTYLTQKPAEEEEDYKYRKKRSTLTNFFKRSIQTMNGRIFEDLVTVTDTSSEFEQFSENVDLEGRSLHRFASDVSELVLRDNLRYIVVDAPSSEGVTNRAEEQAAGIRPYFIEVDPRSVLGVKEETVRGQKIITQFRYMESVLENSADEFQEKTVEQIRVIEAFRVRLYRKDSSGEWHFYDEIPTSIDFCPVVPVYADRQGFIQSRPPLIGVADLNIAHWNSESQQTVILDYSRSPILHHAGHKAMPNNEGVASEVKVGPGSYVADTDPNAKLNYVEPQGAAIEAGRQHGLDLEERARQMGAEFAAPQKSGDVTATQVAIDKSGDTSNLAEYAQNLLDSLYVAFDMVGEMIESPFQGVITLNTELGIIPLPVNMDAISKFRATRDISQETVLDILNREYSLSLSVDEERERMEGEMVMGEEFPVNENDAG